MADMLNDVGKARRRDSLYSLADWKYHHNRLGYDDLIDGRNRLVVTVNVMDLARDEMLNPRYVEDSLPRRIFVLENDNRWTIYLNLKWLTPKTVQRVLDEFGGIINRQFVFKPYSLPSDLIRKYRKAAERMRGEAENVEAHMESKSAAEFLRSPKVRGTQWKAQSRKKSTVAPKRLVEVSTHKLKF